MTQTTLPTARRDLVLALGFRHIIDRPGDAFGPVTEDYAEAARLAGVSTSDVECFAQPMTTSRTPHGGGAGACTCFGRSRTTRFPFAPT